MEDWHEPKFSLATNCVAQFKMAQEMANGTLSSAKAMLEVAMSC